MISSDSQLLKVFDNLRDQKLLKVFDTHMHPMDVMGIETNHSHSIKKVDYNKLSLSELLKLGVTVQLLLEIVFKVSKRTVEKSVKSMYSSQGVDRLLEEMNISGVDMGVLIPLEPWVKTETIKNIYGSVDRFMLLGSVDLHGLDINNLESSLDNLLKLGIRGLKLHPNLQGFYPQPKDNNIEISRKLHIIYKFVEKNNLYILFHGGRTRFTKLKGPDGKEVKGIDLRSRNFALLEKFCDVSGNSELFEQYRFPMVIAHLGAYALIRPNYKMLKVISNKFKNIYFDTAGVSPKVIEKSLNIIGSDRILFGSDAQYYNLRSSINFCLLGIENSSIREDKEIAIKNIFENNFIKIISNKIS